jgi:hypothetical protein
MWSNLPSPNSIFNNLKIYLFYIGHQSESIEQLPLQLGTIQELNFKTPPPLIITHILE